MANHAGLLLVLETKKGYIDELGNITEDIEKARKIPFSQAGFSSAYHVFHKLGYSMNELKEWEIRYFVYQPSYESRIDQLEALYKELGYDNFTSSVMAENSFKRASLENDKRFLIFKKSLEEAVMVFCRDEKKTLTVKDLDLYQKKDSRIHVGELVKDCYYSSEGNVYSYSFELKTPMVEQYFDCSKEEQAYFNHWQNEGLAEYVKEELEKNKFECHVSRGFKVIDCAISQNNLSIYVFESSKELEGFIASTIRKYYSIREMHITRMFGSYVLLQRRNQELEAVKATPIPIQYCPLMVKLLKEVGGDYAETLLDTLKTDDKELQTKMMCQLINEVVIKGGYFDTSRPLNSCEANVLFGASEIMSSAFKSNLIDASVIVSNNLGTIITTNDSNTQGAVKRMTGLFYTSPSEELLKTAYSSSIIPVFPVSAKIDQLEGVKRAISLGYKKIAVSVAASDNILHEELQKLETDGVRIYKFGLCSTGISKEVALSMQKHADIIWSCASKYVKELIEPSSLAQVGIKIPVHIMTKNGWELVRNHLLLNGTSSLEESLVAGDEKPIYLNDNGKIKVLRKKEIKKCVDCPSPCI